jgi:hypothetical protein
MMNLVSNAKGVKNCRKYVAGYPNFKPVLFSLSVTSSVAGVYTLVYINGENFLPNGDTYIHFGPVTNIPVNYYSSSNISFVVPPINNIKDVMTYNVVAVNIYNGGYGFAVKYPGVASVNYSNPLKYTVINSNSQNLPPPDYGYGPFIYPYPPPYPNPESSSEADTFTYASKAYYNEQLAILFLNNEIIALQDVVTQVKSATNALLAIQIAQTKITEAINQNLNANLYQVNLTTAQQQYKTAIQRANLDINYAQNEQIEVIAALQNAEVNIQNTNTTANLAVTQATTNGNSAIAIALAQTTQNEANFLSINTSGTLQNNINQFLEDGLLANIQTQINQFNRTSSAINIINSYIDNIKNFINYLTVVETWTNAVIMDASAAIIPLANG